MRVLFVYKYLTLGGVETVLRARLDGLAAWGIHSSAWFFHDLGGRSLFQHRDDAVRIGTAAECARHSRNFDVLATIDTEEVLPPLRRVSPRPALVVECHSPYLENLEYLRSLSQDSPRAVLVPSHHQREIVRQRIDTPTPVRVVPNPLRAAFIRPLGEELPLLERPIVAWIGRLDELKNWRGFLEMGAALLDRCPEVELAIAGKPVDDRGADELLAAAKATKTLGRLRWLRGLPHDRVPALLDLVRASGGVVVSTSRGDSFGMTVAEAMARGCAVVAPGEGPFNEFVRHGDTGSLYDPTDIVDAARQVEILLRDQELRVACGLRARDAILARHAPDIALGHLAGELRRLDSQPA